MEEIKKIDIQKISLEFRQLLEFSYKDFEGPFQWSDAVGASFVKKYGDSFASIYKIGINSEELQKESQQKNLWVSVAYGRDTKDGIVMGAGESGISNPIDLNSSEDFFYNTNTRKFFYHNKEIIPQQILEAVEIAHFRPTNSRRLQFRLWRWRKLFPSLIRRFDLALIDLLWLISGEKTNADLIGRLLGKNRIERFHTKSSTDADYEKLGTMEFFGYRAKRWSVVFYGIFHLLLFVFFYWQGIKPPIFVVLITNNFLALCYAVFSFAITERGMPSTLKWLVTNITPKLFGIIAFKTLKIPL